MSNSIRRRLLLEKKEIFSVGDIVKVTIYPEECCDACYEVIHNHIKCPVCNSAYAPTNIYGDISDNEPVRCEECNTLYTKLDDYWHTDECEVVITELNYK